MNRLTAGLGGEPALLSNAGVVPDCDPYLQGVFKAVSE